MPRPKKNAPAAAPQGVEKVGQSLLARFRYHPTATLDTVAVFYGSSQNTEQARRIVAYMVRKGYCELKKQKYGQSSIVILNPQWISWEHAYKAWCHEWGLEVAA